MAHSKVPSQQRHDIRRSTDVSLSPYFIDDIAMTSCELERVRRTDVLLVRPR